MFESIGTLRPAIREARPPYPLNAARSPVPPYETQSMPNLDIGPALEAWTKALGFPYVETSPQANAEAAAATFPWDAAVHAVLRPADREQVRECLRVAAEFRIPVHPFSRGRNWGLGSKAPPRDAVLLDLSRLDRIVAYDETLAYLTVEPGVTFQQAADYLRARRSPHFLPVIGGPPTGSVLGNVLERGEAAGPYGQRCEHVAQMEVILPNGATVHTGFGRFAGASTGPLHRHGVGPSLDGIFTQSNFGVVTELTVWLTPRPQAFRSFLAVLREPDRLPSTVDAVRRLLLERVLEPCGAGFWNSFKYLASTSGYPWAALGERTPWDRARLPAGPWYLGGAILNANELIARAVTETIDAALRPLVDELHWYGDEHRDNVYLGEPTEQNSRAMYWRKRQSPGERLAPETDRCGVIWLCLALPLRGDEIRRVLDLCESVIWRAGFEPNLGFNATHGRVAHLYVSLSYDRDVAGEDERAVACHDELLDQCLRLGHFPYRLGHLSQRALPAPADDYSAVWQSLKQAFDPNDILSPGRYEPRR